MVLAIIWILKYLSQWMINAGRSCQGLCISQKNNILILEDTIREIVKARG